MISSIQASLRAQAEVAGLDRSVSRTVKNGSKTSSCGTTPSSAPRGAVVGDHVVPHARARCPSRRARGRRGC